MSGKLTEVLLLMDTRIGGTERGAPHGQKQGGEDKRFGRHQWSLPSKPSLPNPSLPTLHFKILYYAYFVATLVGLINFCPVNCYLLITPFSLCLPKIVGFDFICFRQRWNILCQNMEWYLILLHTWKSAVVVVVTNKKTNVGLACSV